MIATKPRIPHIAPPISRLERAKRMTICVGVLSNEGIVIAADTEESAGDSKRDQQKIFNFVSGMPRFGSTEPARPMMIVSGAGEAGYLDAFIYALSKKFSAPNSMTEFEEMMAEEIMLFHERHIFPISKQGETPQIIQVLMAVTCGFDTSLLVSNGSTVRRAFKHTAIGYGNQFAQRILDQQPIGFMTLREAQLMAAYVVHVTKAQVVTCGLRTTMSSLHQCSPNGVDEDGKTIWRQPNTPMECGFHPDVLRKWETSIDTKWLRKQNALLSELMDDELKSTVWPH